MGKNIVICCDGTANEFAKDNTNVVKLYYTLEDDPTKQVTYYHPGIGTMEPAGALTTMARRITKLLGMALGYGLSNDVRECIRVSHGALPADRSGLFFRLQPGSLYSKSRRILVEDVWPHQTGKWAAGTLCDSHDEQY